MRHIIYHNRSPNSEKNEIEFHYEDNLVELRSYLIFSILKPVSYYIHTAAVNICRHQQQVVWNSFSFSRLHGYLSFHPLLGRTNFRLPVGRYSCTSLAICL